MIYIVLYTSIHIYIYILLYTAMVLILRVHYLDLITKHFPEISASITNAIHLTNLYLQKAKVMMRLHLILYNEKETNKFQ